MKTKQTDAELMPILTVLLVVLIAAPSCRPSTATVKVTLSDRDGVPLPGLTVTAGTVLGQTDSRGVAALKGLTPGHVTLEFSGGRYMEQRDAGLRAGSNTLSYVLEPLSTHWPIRSFDELARMRVRIHQSDDGSPTAEGTLVSGRGSQWKITDGSEVVVLGEYVYFRRSGEAWQQLVGPGRSVPEAEKVAKQACEEIQVFEVRVLDSATEVRSLGRAEIKGYECRTFRVEWSSAGQSGVYTVQVIAQGPHEGFVASFYAHEMVLKVFEFLDLDGAYDIVAPM